MLEPSIRRPLAAALLAGVVLVALVASRVIGAMYESATETAAEASLRTTEGMFRALERAEVKKLDATLSALLDDPELRRHFLARDRERLQAAARPRFDDLKARDAITHWYFTTPDRRVVLRVHHPGLFGDQVDRTTLREAARSGNMAAGLELGPSAFALRVVRPWIQDGTLIGYMELAEEIGHVLLHMKQETGNDFGILIKKQYLDEADWKKLAGGARNTWNARPDVVVVDTTTFSEGLLDYQGDVGQLPDEGLILDRAEREGRAWIRGLFPVTDAAGRKVGALAVLHDFSGMQQVMLAGRQKVLLVVLGMSLLACLVVWVALEHWALRPIRSALAQAEAAAGADGPGTGTADELRRLQRLARRLRGGPDRTGAPGGPP
jgi:hypothetical protein